jgi:hypothetical protein
MLNEAGYGYADAQSDQSATWPGVGVIGTNTATVWLILGSPQVTNVPIHTFFIQKAFSEIGIEAPFAMTTNYLAPDQIAVFVTNKW